MKKILSINLGTAFSRCYSLASLHNDVIRNNNVISIPTAICVLSPDNIIVGKHAIKLKESNPEFFEAGFIPYINEPIEVNGVHYRQIVHSFLQSLIDDTLCGNSADELDIIIVKPAYFSKNDSRKEIIENVLIDIGFSSVKFISEPLAVLHYFRTGLGEEINGNSVIFDFGANSLSISIIQINNDNSLSIIDSVGTFDIGMQSIDEAIYAHATELSQANGKILDEADISDDFAKCVALRENLSSSNVVGTNLSNGVRFTLDLEELKKLSTVIIDESFSTLDKLLENNKIKHTEISNILLSGGGSNLIFIKDRIKRHFNSFGNYNIKILDASNSDKHVSGSDISVIGAGLSCQPVKDPDGCLEYESKEYILKEGLNTIGRSDEMSISINVDNRMRFSRHHFDIIKKKEKGLKKYILTNSSSQYTFVGGMCIGAFGTNETELSDGDIITAGKLKFKFKIKK